MKLSNNQFQACVTLRGATCGTYDLNRLAGARNTEIRQIILSDFVGTKQPKSKSGINALKNVFFDFFKPEGNCQAARESSLKNSLIDSVDRYL